MVFQSGVLETRYVCVCVGGTEGERECMSVCDCVSVCVCVCDGVTVAPAIVDHWCVCVCACVC